MHNLKGKVRKLPHKPGVYLMRDRLGKVIYVGKAKDLKKRVSSYFQSTRQTKFREDQPKIAKLVNLIYDLEVIEVKNEAEALILEGKLIKQWKPKYNTDFKDDKRFLMVKVDIQNKMPQFRLIRNKTDSKSKYFGPFPNPANLKKTLKEMRAHCGIMLGDSRPKRLENGKYRLYHDVRSEIYAHKNEISETEYRQRVDQACEFLEGNARELELDVEVAMQKASGKKQYEKAASMRDLLYAMRATLKPRRQFEKDLASISSADALSLLKKVLGLEKTANHIECFDISHISGTFVVASMICFKKGLPSKQQYRHFKIKSFIGNDDYRAMEEVVGRRYRRLQDEKREFPDLIIIDGGQGQVNAVLKAFLALELEPPLIIGLEKKQETIIFADKRRPLNLQMHSPALQLLQRVRDEAHRFANAFNADLRSKRIKESVLDGFPGLGPLRKANLLQHFKSLENIKKATEVELREVPGVGPKMTTQLKDFLKKI